MVTEETFFGLDRTLKRTMRLAMVLSFFVTLLNMIVPMTMFMLFLWVIPSDSTAGIGPILLLGFGGLVFTIAFEGLRSAATRQFSRHLNDCLGEPILLDLFNDQANERQHSDARGAMVDLKKIRNFFTTPTATAVLDVVMAPLQLLIVYWLSPLLALVATLCVGLVAAMKFASRKSTSELLQKNQIDAKQANDLADEAMAQAQSVRALGMQGDLLARWGRLQDRATRDQSLAHEKTGDDAALTTAVSWIMQVGLMGLGFSLIFSGHLHSAGAIVAVMIASRVIMPLQMVFNSWPQLIETKDGLLRLKQYFALRAKREVLRAETRLDLPAPRGALRAENLVYVREQAVLLQGISFQVQPGQVLAVAGPSGAGKSTLARILAGAARPRDGLLRLDGADLYQWDPAKLGPHIGYLPQEVELFAGTVAENIARFATPDAERLALATGRAGLTETLDRLPAGLETMLEEGGLNIPGGLRQRIGLARALYGEPRLLILDEPDASLDQAGIAALIGILQQASARATTVVLVSHKLSLLRLSHLLLILQQGRILQFGPTMKVLQQLQAPAAPAQLPKTPAEPMHPAAVPA